MDLIPERPHGAAAAMLGELGATTLGATNVSEQLEFFTNHNKKRLKMKRLKSSMGWRARHSRKAITGGSRLR
jgi:hypothetical protein